MTLLFKIMMTTLILCAMATTLCVTNAAVSWQQSKVDKYMAYAGLFFIVLVVDMVLLSVILIWRVNWLLIE